VVPRLVVPCVATAVLAGCGGSDGGDPTTTTAARPTTLALTLDFAPNAVHTGLYLAQERGLFRRDDLDLKIRVPGSGTDGAKLLAAGRTDVAIMDIHDVALGREKGADLVAVGAVVQRPLAAVLASADVRRPRALEGRTVGVTGLPSDDAALDQIVRGDGGDPAKVKRVTIGYEAVASVVSGKVDAAIGFWNAEGVALTARRPGTRVFRLDAYGAPRYPELLLVATSRTLARKGAAVARLARDVGAGYRIAATATTGRDGAAIRALRDGSGDRTIDPATTSQQLRAVQPAFRDAAGNAGTIDRAAMRRWATWEAEVGITRSVPDVSKLVWSRAPGA
jgi:NitT/TauT family transport system substrate-binding protein/putative hydroxymethylpyrimidine transport system substrate-binding protein